MTRGSTPESQVKTDEFPVGTRRDMLEAVDAVLHTISTGIDVELENGERNDDILIQLVQERNHHRLLRQEVLDTAFPNLEEVASLNHLPWEGNDDDRSRVTIMEGVDTDD
jgi:hypothetical protein